MLITNKQQTEKIGITIFLGAIKDSNPVLWMDTAYCCCSYFLGKGLFVDWSDQDIIPTFEQKVQMYVVPINRCECEQVTENIEGVHHSSN